MVEQGQAKSPLAWEFGVAPQQWLGWVQLHLQVLPPYWQAEALQASVALLQSPAYHARPAHLAVPANCKTSLFSVWTTFPFTSHRCGWSCHP